MRRILLEFYEGFRIALVAIGIHKLRSVLTTLGIIIGIVSVTAMFTTINGIERGFERSIEMLGTNVLYVQKWPWVSGSDWWKYINRPNITQDLAEEIRKRSRYAEAVAAIAQTSRTVRYRDRTLSGVFVQGAEPDIVRVENISLTAGRYFTEQEYLGARQVCIIGADVAEGLFPVENPLGKIIRVGGHKCEVIGVLERQGKFLGLFSFDTQVHMPLTTFKKLFGLRNRSLTIEVRVPSAELMDAAEDELEGILRIARGLDPMEENNFAINRQEVFRRQFDQIKMVIYTVGILLTGLSLLVGGIGVMNIMFVSVKERTREIGIRKAVGAPRRAILIQFLIEAVMICSIGGLIGILLSYGVTEIINRFFTAYLSVGTVLLAFTITVLVGIVFGFIPAWQASRANPIDALRYE